LDLISFFLDCAPDWELDDVPADVDVDVVALGVGRPSSGWFSSRRNVGISSSCCLSVQ
jgi:hypothetical protein